MPALTLALLGLGLLAGAIAVGVRRLRFMATAVGTTGRVVRIVDRVEESDKELRPITFYDYDLAFTLPDGTSVEFRNQYGRSRPEFGVGHEVAVRYDPRSAATTAELLPSSGSDLMFWLVLAAPGLLGLLLLRTALDWMRS